MLAFFERYSMTEASQPGGEIVLFESEEGGTKIQVRLHGQTVWLTQRLIAQLYQISVPTVNEHLANIYGDKELTPEATIRKFRIVQTEGPRQVERLVERSRCRLFHRSPYPLKHAPDSTQTF